MNSQVYERMRREMEEEAENEARAAARLPALLGQADVCECGEIELVHADDGRCEAIGCGCRSFRPREVAREDAA